MLFLQFVYWSSYFSLIKSWLCNTKIIENNVRDAFGKL